MQNKNPDINKYTYTILYMYKYIYTNVFVKAEKNDMMLTLFFVHFPEKKKSRKVTCHKFRDFKQCMVFVCIGT